MSRVFVLAVMAGTMLTGGSFAQTIRIGVEGPFTGPSASIGGSMRDGVQLATTEINKAGGIMGRKIVLAERDDQSRDDIGIQIAQELTNGEKVVAMLGFVDTSVALAAQHFYQEVEIPVLTIVATGAQITGQFVPPAFKANYIFRTALSDAIQPGLIVREAITRQKLKAPAILTDNSEYGQTARAAIETALAAQRDDASRRVLAIVSIGRDGIARLKGLVVENQRLELNWL